MSLRAACTYFFYILPSPIATLDLPFQRNALRQGYAHFLHDRLLQVLCEQERNGILPDNHLVCSGCFASHPDTLFYPVSRDEQPEKRICRGREGLLWICAHVSLTWEQLHCGGRQFWCGKSHGLCGLRPSPHREDDQDAPYLWFDIRERGYKRIGPSVEGQRGCLLGPVEACDSETSGTERAASRMRQAADQKLVVRYEHVLLHCGAKEKISNSQIKEHLSFMADGKGFCPHLSTANVVALLDQQPYQDCPRRGSHGANATACSQSASRTLSLPYLHRRNKKAPNKGPCRQAYHCPHPPCATTFSLHRTRIHNPHSPPRDELLLIVHRTLGALSTPKTPLWTTQLQEPRRVSDIPFPLHNCPPHCCAERRRYIESHKESRPWPKWIIKTVIEKPCCGVLLPCCRMETPECGFGSGEVLVGAKTELRQCTGEVGDACFQEIRDEGTLGKGEADERSRSTGGLIRFDNGE